MQLPSITNAKHLSPSALPYNQGVILTCSASGEGETSFKRPAAPAPSPGGCTAAASHFPECRPLTLRSGVYRSVCRLDLGFSDEDAQAQQGHTIISTGLNTSPRLQRGASFSEGLLTSTPRDRPKMSKFALEHLLTRCRPASHSEVSSSKSLLDRLRGSSASMSKRCAWAGQYPPD